MNKNAWSVHLRSGPQSSVSSLTILRPDFLVLRNRRIEAVLDAKYRDLWETNCREKCCISSRFTPWDMRGNRRATIIYPTLDDAARQQIILVKDPLRGTSKAEIILRPVNLLKLDLLLRDKGAHAQRSRINFATRLAFGELHDVSTN